MGNFFFDGYPGKHPLIYMGGWLVVVAAFIIGTRMLLDEPDEIHKRMQKAYEQTSIIADTNNRDGTDKKEWAKVYEELGLHYDEFTSNPRKDLTLNQLEKYVAENNK